jgi:hypothetical protein
MGLTLTWLVNVALVDVAVVVVPLLLLVRLSSSSASPHRHPSSLSLLLGWVAVEVVDGVGQRA